jgi:phage pi2 protein 07
LDFDSILCLLFFFCFVFILHQKTPSSPNYLQLFFYLKVFLSTLSLQIMAEIIVKVSFRGELRRFRFAGGNSFYLLTEELKKVLLLPAEAEFSVVYKDDEGDRITMGSNAELTEALQLASKGILHLTVISATDSFITPSPFATSSTTTLLSIPATPTAFTLLPPHPAAALPQVAYGTLFKYKHMTPPSPVPLVPPPAMPVAVASSPILPHLFPHPPTPAHHQRPTPIPVQTPLPPQVSSPSSFASQCHQQRVKMQEWREEREKAFKQWKAQEKQAKKQEKRQAKAAAKQPMLVARFVKDVTVQDGMFFPPNASFVKTWRLRNESAIPWPEGAVELVFDGKNSDQMGGPEAVVVPTVVPAGSEVDITLNLVSPSKPGRYVGFWRLRTRDGRKFGQRLWVQIHVTSPEEEARYNEDLQRWRLSLEKLQSLGFLDTKQNIKLLNKYGGNSSKVVKKITKKMKNNTNNNTTLMTATTTAVPAGVLLSSSSSSSSTVIHPLNLPPTI